MPTYRVTYYTLSDGQDTETVTASDPAAAVQLLKDKPYSLFAQVKEIYTMNTTTTQPTPAQQAAEQFRADLRADLAEIMDELHSQRAELVNVRADLEAIRAGLQQASQPAPAATPQDFRTMVITTVIKATDDNGKDTFKAQGEPFTKHGVRIWDEVLPMLGIDPAALKYGKNPVEGIPARVLMGETKNRETGAVGIGPRKVTGKA